MASDDLKLIRREAFLRAMRRANKAMDTVHVALAPIAEELSLHLQQLGFVLRDLGAEGLITFDEDFKTATFVGNGEARADELLSNRPRIQAKTKILCIDTEPEVVARLKESGYTVFSASMGYKTGKREFFRPAPHEVDLIVCDLKRPACFDSTHWGPGANNNFSCKILPYAELDSGFTISNGRRRAVHQLIQESQLGEQIPGSFGSKEVNRAIVDGGVPFLLFLNDEWISRTVAFPNWLELSWHFSPTSITAVDIAEPLSTLVPELGKEIKLKLSIRNRIEKGPQPKETPQRYPIVVTKAVSDTIGDTFGQVVRIGKGSAWLVPATHQNVEMTELFALRLNRMKVVLNPVSPRTVSHFSASNRVRLWFLLKDFLPAPQPHFAGGETGGEEMWELRELLQRTLGRMEIGIGDGIATILNQFVMNAPEGELLSMLEVLPTARARGIAKKNSQFHRTTASDGMNFLGQINQFLVEMGSPARFNQDGSFTRDGFVDEVPAALKNLPGKDQLQSDITRLGQQSFALIYFDIDNFKKVNDTNGHAAGDSCLEAIAVLAGGAIVGKGRLYRYGGDEFVIVLPNFCSNEAYATAERIRLAIQETRPGGNVDVSASIGVAATEIEGIDTTRLIHAADAAMYSSKAGGKNRITRWTGSTGYEPRKRNGGT